MDEYWSEELGCYQGLTSYDLYYHSRPNQEAMIARDGDDEFDFISGFYLSDDKRTDPNDPLVEAGRRARLFRLPVPN